MTSQEVRQRFLSFFEGRGHQVIPSASLVPSEDPTLLFTNAGMVPFKPYFLGQRTPDSPRATSAQRCLRVSGKHNDLETVGPSPRHLTFFEMLGNFSFGDYFKEDAITHAWQLLTDDLGIDRDRLWPTIYDDDDEAAELWKRIAGVADDRITRLGKSSNFWTMGDSGPCGPCSEIIYDRGADKCTCKRTDCHLRHDDCDRWWEIWNLVFMQYDLQADGSLVPLAARSVDTGMGMERLVAVLHGKDTVFETDLFQPIIDRVKALVGDRPGRIDDRETAFRAIADHARSSTFLVADGILPGSEKRSYVLRLLMRRAIRFGKLLGMDEPFLADLVHVVVDIMGGHYQELADRRDRIAKVVREEEDRFERTLKSGLGMVDDIVKRLGTSGATIIPGDDVFKLYDTHGFPHVLTRDIARERGLEIDEQGFEALLDEQRERSRASAGSTTKDAQLAVHAGESATTSFVGYDGFDGQGTVVRITRDDKPVDQADDGDAVCVVLDRTPFYAESGGQVGDAGTLSGPDGCIQVEDTQSTGGVFVHRGVVSGRIAVGQTITAAVDRERRLDVMRNHTGTHLLHRALRQVLGEHAEQAGSLVAPERLRFDYNQPSRVSPEQLQAIESQVNAVVRADLPVNKKTVPYRAALDEGAVAIFGEKYGDEVRVVSVDGDFDGADGCYSKELCGGTHLERTGQIGAFYIVSDSGIGSGIRRMEAVTGRGAEAYARLRFGLVSQLAQELKVSDDDVAQQVTAMSRELAAKRKEVARLERELAKGAAGGASAQKQEIDGVGVIITKVEASTVDVMREMSDAFQRELAGVVVIAAVVNDKPMVVVSVAEAVVARGVKAGAVAKVLGASMGGSGGGRPTMAQAGGKAGADVDEVLVKANEVIREQLDAS